MQQQHMHGPHGHRHHFFLKFVFIFLIIGALFSFGNRGWGRGQQSAYWQGFQAGVASVASGAESAATAPQVPPVAPFGPMGNGGPFGPMAHGWGGPGFPVFFLLPFCGLALFAFMGFLFAISRGGRRRAWAHGSRDCWGEAKGPQAKPVTDDEIGPEKSPEDFL